MTYAHEEEETSPHTPKPNPPHPRMSLCELPSTGGEGGGDRSHKDYFPNTWRCWWELGEGQGSKGPSGVAPQLGQHPSPGMKCSGQGLGPNPHKAPTLEAGTCLPSHTHTQYTRTHTPHVHLCPRCTGPPTDTQSEAHSRVPRALTRSL